LEEVAKRAGFESFVAFGAAVKQAQQHARQQAALKKLKRAQPPSG
jgi:hypothetical protein